MIISLIACIGKNRELGLNNDLIWKIPEDLKYFKSVTKGHAVIMGQKTFESIGRPLPERVNIVLSDNPDFSAEGIIIARSMDAAIDAASQNEKEEIFFIGGAYVYSQAIKLADKLYLTLVDGESPADAYFPDYSNFKLVENKGEGEYNGIRYNFLILDKHA